MRRALVVGIDFYNHLSPLFGCVNDAKAVSGVLARHGDGRVNFGVELQTANEWADQIGRAALKESVRELFAEDGEVALFYFAGHGHVEDTGGYLCTSDCALGDEGLPMRELMDIANRSKARDRIIILDCCHSGAVGTRPLSPATAEIHQGLTILTASTTTQYATEENGSGLFTTLLVDALNGSAANLEGHITPGSAYAHIDQSLGQWGQRPMFKTHVKYFISLRTVQPPISLTDLHRITEFFPSPRYEFPLDPDYEPESESPDPEKTAVFAILQKYNRVNLLVPVGAPHMWHAAMQRRSCKLTVLGEHYWRLVKDGCI